MLEEKILLFLQTAQKQSLARAADEMAIEEDEAQEMIRSLEQQLNVKLFSEFQGKLRLTRLGEKFYHGCTRLFEMANELLEEMDYTPVPQIQIGFSGTRDNQGIIDLVSQYKKSNQQVTFTFRKDQMPNLITALKSGDVDIAFGLKSNFEKESDFRLFDLFDYPLCIVIPEDHAWEKKKKISVEELENENVIVMSRRLAQPFYIEPLQACGLQRGSAASQAEARSMDDLIKTIQLANGIGLAPKESLDIERLEDEDFTLVDLAFPYSAVIRLQEDRPEILSFAQAAQDYFSKHSRKGRVKKEEKKTEAAS